MSWGQHINLCTLVPLCLTAIHWKLRSMNALDRYLCNIGQADKFKKVWKNVRLTVHTKMAAYKDLHPHFALREWNMDSPLQTRDRSEHVPYVQSEAHPRHQVAWLSHKQGDHHVYPAAEPADIATAAMTLLAWPHAPHVRWEDSKGQLVSGTRLQEHPHLCFQDVCKRDLKSFNTDVERWEQITSAQDQWRQK